MVNLHKRYQFRCDDEKLIEFLDKQVNVSESVVNILSLYFHGKLLTVNQAKLEELKIKKITSQIRSLDINSKIKLVHELHLTPDQIRQVVNGDLDVNEMNIAQESILQDDGRLRCKTCGKFFAKTEPLYGMVGSYQEHIKSDHDRDYHDDERVAMNQVLGD